MKLTFLLLSSALAAATPVPVAKLNLNYLPPDKPYQPPLSYLPPLQSGYLPPPVQFERFGEVEENLVDTGEAEEAAVEEEAVEEEAVEEEAVVEEESVSDAGGEEETPAEEGDSGAEDAGEEGSVTEQEQHGVEGEYQLREEVAGHRTTDAREESSLQQSVEDVKTFNSEVHEYEYYPYESYGKEVTVVEPIVGKTYGFHAVPYPVSQPGYAPLRTVQYAPAPYIAYHGAPVYRPLPAYGREPSLEFSEDGTRYVARPPRPAGVVDDAAGGDGDGSVEGADEYASARVPWRPYGARLTSGPIFSGGYSGEEGYGGSAWSGESGEEAEVAASGAEEAADSGVSAEAEVGSETDGVPAEAVSSVAEEGGASAAAVASVSAEGEGQSVQVSAGGTATDGASSSAEASASAGSEGPEVSAEAEIAGSDASAAEAGANRRIATRQIQYGSPYDGFVAPPAWWPVSPYPYQAHVNSARFADRSDVQGFNHATPSEYHAATYHGDPSAASAAAAASAGYQDLAPSASVTHETFIAPPAGYTPGTYSPHAAIPPVADGLVYEYTSHSVVPRAARSVGSEHVREGNIPGYYVRCVRHDNGPPSVSLVPFAQ